MTDWLLQGDFTPQPIDYKIVALSLLLAFICGHLVSWLYTWTHNGLSYSRSFVKALVLMPVIVAMVLLLLSNSIVTAFGLMAVLAIVRFRNVLRDTLDTSFLLAGIVMGMACGTKQFTTAIVCMSALAIIFVYLWFTQFGSRYTYDLILNINWARPVEELPALASTLNRHSLRVQTASQFASRAGGTDLSYRLLLRDPGRTEELLSELRSLEGITRVNTVAAENESEA